mmetsp:Transcript_44100/g.81498  ORF Transcript_44100/g.81498 Transcript_44100/m.81498 type:complete len:231 (+) Transcript_44100:235-927(+)
MDHVRRLGSPLAGSARRVRPQHRRRELQGDLGAVRRPDSPPRMGKPGGQASPAVQRSHGAPFRRGSQRLGRAADAWPEVPARARHFAQGRPEGVGSLQLGRVPSDRPFLAELHGLAGVLAPGDARGRDLDGGDGVHVGRLLPPQRRARVPQRWKRGHRGCAPEGGGEARWVLGADAAGGGKRFGGRRARGGRDPQGYQEAAAWETDSSAQGRGVQRGPVRHFQPRPSRRL